MMLVLCVWHTLILRANQSYIAPKQNLEGWSGCDRDTIHPISQWSIEMISKLLF